MWSQCSHSSVYGRCLVLLWYRQLQRPSVVGSVFCRTRRAWKARRSLAGNLTTCRKRSRPMLWETLDCLHAWNQLTRARSCRTCRRMEKFQPWYIRFAFKHSLPTKYAPVTICYARLCLWFHHLSVQCVQHCACVRQRLYVSTISPVSVDGFSPDFYHWCILGWTKMNWLGFGVKRQRWPVELHRSSV